MNCVLIFAGGTGRRMNTNSRPKQFMELHGKPIIVQTIEAFEFHPDIDAIVVACLEEWIPFLQRQLRRYDIEKVVDVVPGGPTGQASIRNGVESLAARFPGDAVVLVHDGVRPLVDRDTISACIECTEEHGNAITVVPATETIVQGSDGLVDDIIDRSQCLMARAPQCFRLADLKTAHDRACEEGLEDVIDSATLMSLYGHRLHTVMGKEQNIKITTPIDFLVLRAFDEGRNSSELFDY